jgi:hypothetical protein
MITLLKELEYLLEQPDNYQNYRYDKGYMEKPTQTWYSNEPRQPQHQ